MEGDARSFYRNTLRKEGAVKESAGKALARQCFYREFLPTALPRSFVRAGNYLVLLGDPPRELEHLDALGVDRRHVYSVEHDHAIYRQQVEHHLGVSLHFGEVSEYLNQVLHSNHAFTVLNLDVEGSFRTQLDASMTSVLLFCWRNTETVMATYSSIGRDTETLWEGVQALASFLWLAPSGTIRFIHDFRGRYEQAGFEHPVMMVLRDLMWIRSHLLHIVNASALIGVTSRQSADRFFSADRSLWDGVRAQRLAPISLDALERSVSEIVTSFGSTQGVGDLPALGVSLNGMANVVYRAAPPWSQRCYYTRCVSLDQSISVREWLGQALAGFRSEALTYVDRDGIRHEIGGTDGISGNGDGSVRIWSDTNVYDRHEPRYPSVDSQTKIPPMVMRTIAMLKEQRRSRSMKAQNGEEEAMTKPLVRGGRLTEEGKSRVRVLARQGHDTEAIVAKIPDAPYLSVRALVAVARRTGKGEVFMRGGELTDFGRRELRRLASEGLNTKEIADRVPRTVPRQSIIAHVAVAHRVTARRS